MKENILVKKLIKEDKKALYLFYKLYHKKLYFFIKQKINNKKDIEEVLQDTFISALDSLPLFKFRSSLFTWLCSIARHEIIDFLRRQKIKTIVFSHFPFLERSYL